PDPRRGGAPRLHGDRDAPGLCRRRPALELRGRARARAAHAVRPARPARDRVAIDRVDRLRRARRERAMSAPRVVVSPHNVAGFLEGGGHFWAYMQHVQGLREAGCDVWWLERLRDERDRAEDARRIEVLAGRLA